MTIVFVVVRVRGAILVGVTATCMVVCFVVPSASERVVFLLQAVLAVRVVMPVRVDVVFVTTIKLLCCP